MQEHPVDNAQNQGESSCAPNDCESCSSTCSARSARPDETAQQFKDRQALQKRMCRVKHKILVLSGKGGVGKSTVAVNLAISLALSGKRVGLMDADVHGPSVPRMLGVEGHPVEIVDNAIIPVRAGSISVMSVGFLLRDQDDAVIWRGPMKAGVIQQFLKDVEWGDLDCLVIDSPPGTGDEPLSVCQFLENPDGAVIVTTPQAVATSDVRKSLNFCRQLQLPVLGVIENMSGFVCPKCGEVTQIFQSGGGETMAEEMHVPFLGRIPIDPLVGIACDDGAPYVKRHPESEIAKSFAGIGARLIPNEQGPASNTGPSEKTHSEKDSPMRIAIPLANGNLSMHFGHCEEFILMEVNQETKEIVSTSTHVPPPHEPGVLPKWLHELGANVIIAGGMGQRAQQLFVENEIQVIVGAPAATPKELAGAFLAGTLQTGANVCDH
ncbi:MAG: P-loop NTPase [Nitrospiraceae bacterium]|nr:P-loop NTPase [Nitrospiraceae bacterium]